MRVHGYDSNQSGSEIDGLSVRRYLKKSRPEMEVCRLLENPMKVMVSDGSRIANTPATFLPYDSSINASAGDIISFWTSSFDLLSETP